MKKEDIKILVLTTIAVCLAIALIVAAPNQSVTIFNEQPYILSSTDDCTCIDLKDTVESIFLPSNGSDVVTVEGNSSVFYVNHSLSKSFKVDVEGYDWCVNQVKSIFHPVENSTDNMTSITMDIYIRWGHEFLQS